MRLHIFFLQAVQYLQQAVTFDDKDGHTWEELAYCYLMINDLQNSYTAYQHALYHIQNPKVGVAWVFNYKVWMSQMKLWDLWSTAVVSQTFDIFRWGFRGLSPVRFSRLIPPFWSGRTRGCGTVSDSYMIVTGATATPSRRSMLASRWTQTSSSITRRVGGGVLGEGTVAMLGWLSSLVRIPFFACDLNVTVIRLVVVVGLVWLTFLFVLVLGIVFCSFFRIFIKLYFLPRFGCSVSRKVRFRVGIINKQQGKFDEALAVSFKDFGIFRLRHLYYCSN